MYADMYTSLKYILVRVRNPYLDLSLTARPYNFHNVTMIKACLWFFNLSVGICGCQYQSI